MEALLPPLVAAFLAEWGDKTQLLAAMLAIRFPSRNSVLFAIGLATLLNAALSAFAGSFLIGLISFRARTLMTALALLLAGAGALFPSRSPRLKSRGRGGMVIASLFAFGVLQFGDKTQFITACLAAERCAVAYGNRLCLRHACGRHPGGPARQPMCGGRSARRRQARGRSNAVDRRSLRCDLDPRPFLIDPLDFCAETYRIALLQGLCHQCSSRALHALNRSQWRR